MGEGCFYNSGLKQISLPGGVETLGAMAFMHCWRLCAVSFSGDKLRIIGDECFAKSAVRELETPEGLR